jgi:uncharacterized membrane protein
LEKMDAFSFTAKRNCSLSPRGQAIWITLIASGTLLLALAATALGAWPILPFAGVEVLLVWCAFRWVYRRRGDYEVLKVSGGVFCWEKWQAGRLERLTGSCEWWDIDLTRAPQRELVLRYAGKRVAVGRLMTEAQRSNVVKAILHLRQTSAGSV